ncbi:MAG: ComEC/Rec2 family competence protein [Patescibacteria group bacterium]
MSKTKIRKILLSLFLGITVFIWYAVGAEERGGLLTVAFLDVGQGDAIFIESPSGKQILIDSGPNKKVLRELSKQMPFYDRTLDMLIVTHPDGDHIGGFPAILEAFQIGTILRTGVNCQTELCAELDKQIATQNIAEKIASRGMRLDLGDGVFLDILFPDRDATDFESNLSSLIIKLVFGENSFLLTGDSPQEIEKYLVVLDAENLATDVLKIGHHGSRTSTSELFVGFVNPTLAIISVGANNKYGHPHQEVLDILKNFEIKVLRTDQDSAIVIKSDGHNLMY